MPVDARLAPLLERQDGLVTLAQAVEAGVAARTVSRRVGAGEWCCVLPRVFLVGGHPTTDAVRVRSAALWLGRPAAVSGPAAAWWHGLPATVPPVVELTVPPERAPGRGRGPACAGGCSPRSTSCAAAGCGSPIGR